MLSALAACAGLQARHGDELSGRLAVNIEPHGTAPARSVSAAFELRGSPDQGELQLTSPLGTVMAQARWNGSEALLITADGQRRFPNLAALSQDVLGEALPLQALFDWLRGRPWPGAASRADGNKGFIQLGWSVNLERWPEGWVIATRRTEPVVTVRAKLSSLAP
jgi:outer membrane lipoprotein LolB